MATWWYSLVDEADEANEWEVGTALPAGTDFTRASWLNQFVDRLNVRINVMDRLGMDLGGLSTMARVAPGDFVTQAEDGFIETWRNKAAALVCLAYAPEDSDAVASIAYQTAGTWSACSAYFALLEDGDLSAGDVFWDSDRFEAMRGILDTVTTFGNIVSGTTLSGAGAAKSEVYDYISGSSFVNDTVDPWTPGAEFDVAQDDLDLNTSPCANGGYARMGTWNEEDALVFMDAVAVQATSVDMNLGETAYPFGGDAILYGYGVKEGGVDYESSEYAEGLLMAKGTAADVSVAASADMAFATNATFGVTSYPNAQIPNSTPYGYNTGYYAVLVVKDSLITF